MKEIIKYGKKHPKARASFYIKDFDKEEYCVRFYIKNEKGDVILEKTFCEITHDEAIEISKKLMV